MEITYLKLKRIAYFCLLLPSLIFAAGYLKWYIGVPIAALCLVAYFFVLKDIKKEKFEYEERRITISAKQFVALVGIVMLWCYLSGLGNLYYQSDDWFARNAIFRDLIRFDWPVKYSLKDAALVYYIGYWMPPALVGKAFYAMTADLDVAWAMGNFALWLWSVICIVVVILMVAVFVNANTKKRFKAVVLIFIFFSGLDIVGTMFNKLAWGWAIPNHIEWWSRFQFSSMTTCLGWVFNQCILSWMAVICFLSEKKLRNYAFIIACAVSSAPIPCVGLAIYMVGVAAVKLWRAFKEEELNLFWRDVFTVQNIVLTVTMVPVYFLYYKSNLAVNVGQSTQGIIWYRDWRALITIAVLFLLSLALGLFLRTVKKSSFEVLFFAGIMGALLIWSLVDLNIGMSYLFFVLLEGGVFLFLIWRDNRREPLFYITWVVIIVCPLITIGTASDFCMRASIPAVFVLMVMCVKYLFAHWEELCSKKINVTTVTTALLVAALVLGAFTAVAEYQRGIVAIIREHNIVLVNDWAYTMNRFYPGALEGVDRNFIASNCDRMFFFKYLAK